MANIWQVTLVLVRTCQPGDRKEHEVPSEPPPTRFTSTNRPCCAPLPRGTKQGTHQNGDQQRAAWVSGARHLRVQGENAARPAVSGQEWQHWYVRDTSNSNSRSFVDIGPTPWDGFLPLPSHAGRRPSEGGGHRRVGGSWWGATRDVLSAPQLPQQPPARGASTPEATSSSADRRQRATPEKPPISLPRVCVKHFSAVLPRLFIHFWHMSYAFPPGPACAGRELPQMG